MGCGCRHNPTPPPRSNVPGSPPAQEPDELSRYGFLKPAQLEERRRKEEERRKQYLERLRNNTPSGG